nr:MAG TPA: hypothetical protein [Caudoviricetes sp.]
MKKPTYPPSVGVRSRSSRARGNQVCSQTVHRERG